MTQYKDQEDKVDARYVIQMNTLAHYIDEVFQKQVGFCLLIFPFEEINGRVNYISNAQRDSMLQAMKEFIARAEGRLAPNQSIQ